MTTLSAERRRRLTHRAFPALGALAVIAFGAGLTFGAGTPSPAERTAGDFAEAWERGDYRAMHAMLDDASRRAHPLPEFRRAYRQAAATATATAVTADSPEGERGGAAVVPVEVSTRVFGPVRAELVLPVNGERVTWGPLLAFPGLRPGEGLSRRSDPPIRGTLLSR